MTRLSIKGLAKKCYEYCQQHLIKFVVPWTYKWRFQVLACSAVAIKIIMEIKIISQNLEFLRHLNLLIVRFDNLDSRCSLQISIMSYIFIIFFKGWAHYGKLFGISRTVRYSSLPTNGLAIKLRKPLKTSFEWTHQRDKNNQTKYKNLWPLKLLPTKNNHEKNLITKPAYHKYPLLSWILCAPTPTAGYTTAGGCTPVTGYNYSRLYTFFRLLTYYRL